MKKWLQSLRMAMGQGIKRLLVNFIPMFWARDSLMHNGGRDLLFFTNPAGHKPNLYASYYWGIKRTQKARFFK